MRKATNFDTKHYLILSLNTSFAYHQIQFSCHIDISFVTSLNIYPKYINGEKLLVF